MNKVYYELAIKEAYLKGVTESQDKYEKVIKFLEEHKDRNNYISKKIKLLLEDLKK